MEIKLFVEKESLFDHYVASHPRGDVLQTTAWGRVKESSGWQAYPLGVMDQGKLAAAALILTKPLPLFPAAAAYSPGAHCIRRLKPSPSCLRKVQPFLGAREGWFGRWTQPSPKVTEVARSGALPQPQAGGDWPGLCRGAARFVMTLDLTRSLDTLLNNMKSKTRYNIRYAMRKGVYIQPLKEKSRLSVFTACSRKPLSETVFLSAP